MQSQFVVSQAIIPKIASGLRHLININDNDIHRILIETHPYKRKCILVIIIFMTKTPYKFILFFSFSAFNFEVT